MGTLQLTTPLVTANWLKQHLKAENLIVLDATINKVYKSDNLQIKNARFFDIKNNFSDVNAPFPSTYPSEKQFQHEAQKLGINQDSAIVVYDDKGIYSSARVWWLFKSFGFKNVAVLDGGFPIWLDQRYPTETMRVYQGGLGNFKAKLHPELMTFFSEVKSASQTNSHVIIDARSARRFQCLEAEPRAGLRMGTIPNSVNLPFEYLLENQQFISVKSIEDLFKPFVKKEDAIIFSCGSGITACVLALGATLAGYNNIAVYDGSWTEWGSLVKD